MSHDETTKKHPGGVSDVESYEKNGRMYKTNSPADGYSALELFLSKLNPQCEALFQYPKRNWRPSDKIWYENRPLGINKLSTMMKDISSAAGLSRVYTNHSVRATAITLWSTAGLTNREIMAISGHRNESSLKSYHSMPSANQLRKCSDVLASALGDNETIRAAEHLYRLTRLTRLVKTRHMMIVKRRRNLITIKNILSELKTLSFFLVIS